VGVQARHTAWKMQSQGCLHPQMPSRTTSLKLGDSAIGTRARSHTSKKIGRGHSPIFGEDSKSNSPRPIKIIPTSASLPLRCEESKGRRDLRSTLTCGGAKTAVRIGPRNDCAVVGGVICPETVGSAGACKQPPAPYLGSGIPSQWRESLPPSPIRHAAPRVGHT